METAVYTVGTLVALLCSVLLLSASRRSKKRLLLWSGLCFAGLALSNALVIVDLVLYPTSLDLYRYRLAIGAVAMLVLVFGLVWDRE